MGDSLRRVGYFKGKKVQRANKFIESQDVGKRKMGRREAEEDTVFRKGKPFNNVEEAGRRTGLQMPNVSLSKHTVFACMCAVYIQDQGLASGGPCFTLGVCVFRPGIWDGTF